MIQSLLVELRMDIAFFIDEILTAPEQASVRYTISVPLARLLSLKEIIERRIEWLPTDPEELTMLSEETILV